MVRRLSGDSKNISGVTVVAVDELNYTRTVPMMPRGAKTAKKRISLGRRLRNKERKLERQRKKENAFDRRTITCLLDNGGSIIVRPGFGLSDGFAGAVGKDALTSKKKRAEARTSINEKKKQCALIAESLIRLMTAEKVYCEQLIMDGQKAYAYCIAGRCVTL